MKFLRKVAGFLILAAVMAAGFTMLTSPQTASAANPTTINFQGKVVKADGTNVTDGTYSFTFKLYSVASGGTAIWGETQASVTVTSGVFQVNLGSTCSLFTTQTCSGFSNTAIDFNANPALYLGITFNSDPAGEMSPRPQLQSVPYAFNADKVGGLAVSQLVQLGPNSVQADASANSSLFINKTSTGNILQLQKNAVDALVLDNTGNLTVSGTYNSNTFTSSTLSFAGASANSINGTSNQNLTIQSQGSGQLTLGTGSGGILGLASSIATVQRTAVGTTTLDLNDVGNTLLVIKNSGSGVANLNLFGGSLQTGSTPTTRLDNAGNLTNIGNYTASGSLSSGYVSSSTTDTVGATTTVATAGTAYFLKSDSLTQNSAITSTINITGLPATDGTLALISATCAKGITSAARVHTCNFQIAGTLVSSVATTSVATAATTTHSFTMVRMNGVWTVVGSGLSAATAAATSTVNTADYAEWIHYSGDTQPQSGDVISIGTEPTSVTRSLASYDVKAIGVVSTEPYQVAGADDGHSVILALTGRVPVAVSLENGPIAIGDKLTSASTPGVAMKATRAGHIIGTALTSYDGSQSLAQVTVQLGAGYDNPTNDQDIISSSLTSSGALVINSGAVGDVSIDTGSANAYVTVGASQAAGVNVSKPNQTTKVAGALVIDQAATFHGGVTIDAADAPGGVLSTNHFNVNGAGDVTTSGSFISKGGNLQMLDATGASLFTIDTAGNGVLTGSLNLASASISGGLTVGGDINVAGLSTFQKLATFLAKSVFKQDVEFDGHITVAADSAGYATLRSTESTVHVKFATAYDNPPVVSTNTVDGQFLLTAVNNISKDGFDITVAQPVTQDTKFSWTAVGVNNPQTATNPLPEITP